MKRIYKVNTDIIGEHFFTSKKRALAFIDWLIGNYNLELEKSYTLEGSIFFDASYYNGNRVSLIEGEVFQTNLHKIS